MTELFTILIDILFPIFIIMGIGYFIHRKFDLNSTDKDKVSSEVCLFKCGAPTSNRPGYLTCYYFYIWNRRDASPGTSYRISHADIGKQFSHCPGI